jgi:hypothetical protein
MQAKAVTSGWQIGGKVSCNNNNTNNNNNNNNFNSLFLCAASTAKRPITDTAQNIHLRSNN